MALTGLAATPPVQPPPSLRPYLRMQKLPRTALDGIRRALDRDDEFRARVAAAVADEDAVGRAGWLLVHRPDGWEAELDAEVAGVAATAAAADEARAEREAERRLAGAERARERAEAARERAEADAAAAEAQLDVERAARRVAADEAAALARRVDALVHERDDARTRLASVEARAAQLEAALRAAEAEAARLASGPDPLAQARAALVDAAASARELVASLYDAAGALEPPPPPPAPGPQKKRTPRPGRARRVPVAPPPGLVEEAPAAVDRLLRTPGTTLLVDGYNATLRDPAWAGLSISDQRTRLVDALSELAVRTGAAVEVWFDGTEHATRRLARAGVGGVRVSFTSADVEADDAILARVEALPVERPVAVASDDNRVRDGASARGANVVPTAVLLGLTRAR